MPARPFAGTCPVAALGCAAALCMAAERPTPGEARALRNPLPYASETVRQGRKTYLRLCQYCHGADGRAQANPDFEAPSLRAPDQWLHGSSDGEVFVSIQYGAGHDMPPFGMQLADEQAWELVHYIRSIGPAGRRPAAGGAR